MNANIVRELIYLDGGIADGMIISLRAGYSAVDVPYLIDGAIGDPIEFGSNTYKRTNKLWGYLRVFVEV